MMLSCSCCPTQLSWVSNASPYLLAELQAAGAPLGVTALDSPTPPPADLACPCSIACSRREVCLQIH